MSFFFKKKIDFWSLRVVILSRRAPEEIADEKHKYIYLRHNYDAMNIELKKEKKRNSYKVSRQVDGSDTSEKLL